MEAPHEKLTSSTPFLVIAFFIDYTKFTNKLILWIIRPWWDDKNKNHNYNQALIYSVLLWH